MELSFGRADDMNIIPAKRKMTVITTTAATCLPRPQLPHHNDQHLLRSLLHCHCHRHCHRHPSSSLFSSFFFSFLFRLFCFLCLYPTHIFAFSFDSSSSPFFSPLSLFPLLPSLPPPTAFPPFPISSFALRSTWQMQLHAL